MNTQGQTNYASHSSEAFQSLDACQTSFLLSFSKHTEPCFNVNATWVPNSLITRAIRSDAMRTRGPTFAGGLIFHST
ncbi:uncharacterized protein FTOL_04927 [Fusarium torulosum]|uniref:Uncharacterized protein n=1 Tax=Fusarium torulosum TaxID=33205 RepID=A0AAE8SGV3_9HYPO|nr:uncharacterized protein FTOL_04927 [Fusarium torulosum]